MTNANWQSVKNSCDSDWRRTVQDVECEFSGAKCRVYVRHEQGGMYDSNFKCVEWRVERFEREVQVLDMSGDIATDESTLKEDFELAKKRAEAFVRCWNGPERTDVLFGRWERDGDLVDWLGHDDKRWKINTPSVDCKVSGIRGRVWAEKDNKDLKCIMWVVSVWEQSLQGLVWALRTRGVIYTSDSNLMKDYELGKRTANKFALCWLEGKIKQ